MWGLLEDLSGFGESLVVLGPSSDCAGSGPGPLRVSATSRRECARPRPSTNLWRTSRDRAFLSSVHLFRRTRREPWSSVRRWTASRSRPPSGRGQFGSNRTARATTRRQQHESRCCCSCSSGCSCCGSLSDSSSVCCSRTRRAARGKSRTGTRLRQLPHGGVLPCAQQPADFVERLGCKLVAVRRQALQVVTPPHIDSQTIQQSVGLVQQTSPVASPVAVRPGQHALDLQRIRLKSMRQRMAESLGEPAGLLEQPQTPVVGLHKDRCVHPGRPFV